MVKVPTLTTCLLLAASGAASATKINFVNKCATPVQLYHSEHFQPLEKVGDIAPGSSIAQDVSGQAHMYRHGFDTDATLAEFSIPNDGKVWYDISVIPPMPGHCSSFEQCKSTTGKRGFNVPLNIVPKTNANGKSCRALTCTADDKAKCADAYHFPDDVKTHDCPSSTEFNVVFCPNGGGGSSTPSQGSPTQQSQSTQAPTTQAPTTQAPTTQAPTTQAPSTKAPVSQNTNTNTNQNKDPTKAPASSNNNNSGVTYGQCLNPATGKMIAKCDPGFECRNGRCAFASASTTHSSNNNNNNNEQTNNFGFGNTDLTNTNQGKVSAPSDSVASEATSAPTKSTSTNTNQNSGGASLGKVRATYSYKGKQAGNVPGSYDRVTQLSGCVKQRVSLHSPVGPLSEEVSLVFRGPMDIYNIAVFDASSGGNSSFTRVSSYARDGGEPDNLVFLNNKNVDYSGQQRHGPQGFATADGVAQADKPTKLKGLLKEASNPGAQGAGPGVQTGAEVNIMTGKKCDGACLGYHGSNDYHGWGGGRKIFVTKVQMPHGASPNQPAIWMLNAQVLHSNQYGCNCRGMGSVGGCGELDIAEVIETNANRDKVTTHYYFYDGSVLSPGGDNFASRPYDRAVSYATIIDDRHDNGNGLVKIVELEDFDYSQDGISDAQYQQLLDA